MTPEKPLTGRRWYQIGPFVVDASKHLLWRGDTLIPLTSKAFEILLVLLQNRGRVVDKQELMDAVWRGTAVEENTLTRHVSTLRRALEERPDQHLFILTVPGYGYQFIADVVELDRRPDDVPYTLTRAPPATVSTDSVGDQLDSSQVASPRRSQVISFVALGAGAILIAATTVLVMVALRSGGAVSRAPQRALRQFTFHSGVQKDPTWSPDGRRVAYASTQAGNSDIWLQTLGSTAPLQVTSAPAEDSQPDWSPDGQWLVFRSERDGGGLFVVPAEGGTPRRISTFGYRPRWSPQGSLILFSSSGHPGGTPKFHVVGLDGQPPQPLRPDLLTDFQTVVRRVATG
jgi:DNA-binding winged helix-turn-helix (wHTH) protein